MKDCMTLINTKVIIALSMKENEFYYFTIINLDTIMQETKGSKSTLQQEDHSTAKSIKTFLSYLLEFYNTMQSDFPLAKKVEILCGDTSKLAVKPFLQQLLRPPITIAQTQSSTKPFPHPTPNKNPTPFVPLPQSTTTKKHTPSLPKKPATISSTAKQPTSSISTSGTQFSTSQPFATTPKQIPFLAWLTQWQQQKSKHNKLHSMMFNYKLYF